jgi:lysophospholipid acyltransferase (LPLAT)-like uncharacterized protein
MSARRRFVQGPLTDVAITFGHRLLLALGTTWRVRHVGGAAVRAARRDGRGVLYALTHGVLLPLAYTHRNRGVRLLISESRDGEIITRITDRLGYASVRGSSTRGGRRALVEMVRVAGEGHDLAVTPDGPRGPRGHASPGAVVIAERSGLPIVPVAVGTSRGWRASSWDRFLVPAPGARVWVVYGPPYRPESGGEGSGVEVECRRLERAMEAAEEAAVALAAGDAAADEPGRAPA